MLVASFLLPLFLGSVAVTPTPPDDPRYVDQWALPMVHALEAWRRTTGSTSIVVAVLDTGITAHPDLEGRIVPGYDFVSDATSAGDGDGRDPDATDLGPWKHGTHVAGIIGARTDNGLGVAGLDWACRVQPVRVIGADRVGKAQDVADAIRWAAGLHVDGVPDNPTPASVINLSLRTGGHSAAEQSAIDEARAQGVTVVAAAGNDGEDAADGSPSGLDGVITVGAVDDQGGLATYSDFGPRVTLLAPGGSVSRGVLSTLQLPNGEPGYGLIAGTSQAAPFVTGTVALMKALAPTMKPYEARALLELAADPSARCLSRTDPSEPGCGAGLLHVEHSLDAAEALAAGTLRIDPPATTGGCSVGGDAGLSPLSVIFAFAVLRVRRRSRGRDRSCRGS